MLPPDPRRPDATATLRTVLQVAVWAILVTLCLIVAMLWTRLAAQVARNDADVLVLKSYSEQQALRVRDEAVVERVREAARWRGELMPLLRQHHQAIQALPLPPEHVQPLPAWLQEAR